jgi:hypothetical protein
VDDPVGHRESGIPACDEICSFDHSNSPRSRPEKQDVQLRVSGGGRKKFVETDPQLSARLKELVDPKTRGDPMSLLGTTKSTRNLAGPGPAR